MTLWLVGWSDGNIHVFTTKDEATLAVFDEPNHTWEEALELADVINSEGNYHEYIVQEVTTKWKSN